MLMKRLPFAGAVLLGAVSSQVLAESSYWRGSDRIHTGTVAPAAQLSAPPATAPDPLPLVAQTPAQQAPAQQTTTQRPPAAATAAPGTTPAPVVDESALRYYARQGDERRLAIEIARLRALYPNWTPPADPLAVPANVDEKLEAVWQLYAEGRFAEARRAVAERRAAEPGWEPPQDLVDRLALAEARERLVNASNLKQYETVIRLGSENPSLLTCSEVDVLWRVAEAFASTDRPQRASDAYRYILGTCDNPQERVATLQNAVRLLPPTETEALLSTERFDAAGKGEFAGVRDDLARRAVALGGEDKAATVSEEYLQRVVRLAGEENKASDALLLGWYNVLRERGPEAERWFRKAVGIEDTVEASQGLALALVAQQKYAEAEAALAKWRDDSEETRKTYLAAVANLLGLEPRPALAPEVLQRMAATVAAQRDVPAAQQFGWYARAFNQFETAERWFTTALSWNVDDEPSAYGLTLTRHQLGNQAGVAEMKRIWSGRSERIMAVGEPNARDGRALTPVPLAPPQPTPGQRAEATMGAQPAARQAVAPATDMQTVTAYAPVEAVAEAAPQPRARAAAPATRAAASSMRQPRGCSTPVSPEQLGPQAALTRGWCLMDLNRPLEAAAAFDVALQSRDGRTRSDASYGQSLAYLRAGLIDDAAVAATRAPQSGGRGDELEASILAERALGAYERGRYAEALIALDKRAQISAERIDLMVLRGYAYLNLRRLTDARRVFEAAAGTGNRDAVRGLADLQQGNSGR